MTLISLNSVQINDRVRWQCRGDYNFGRVTKINKRTFIVRGEKYEGGQVYSVQKELVFEALRD